VSARSRPTGEVFYDAECGFCVAAVARFRHVLARRQLALVPLQAADATTRLGVEEGRLLDEMRLRLDDGRVYGGAEAIAQVARHIWWAWPLWALSRLPGAMWPMDAAYKWFARRRGCVSGACRRD
jgi:predicted DCC family thiol-disulfide oxidoreductase YuxK